MTLRKELDELASAIAKRAADKETPLAEATDALKMVTAYYAVLQKYHKSGEPVDDEPDFGDFAAAVHGGSRAAAGTNGAAHGGVQGRRNRGRADESADTDG
jgi:hypothetical protein